MSIRIFTDQLQREISISYPPKRIISLVPSQTELLFDLGLDAEIAAITRFCVHPKHQVESKTRIGGTKNLDLQRIRSLKPDLIIGNKEENERGQVEQLMQEFPVWMSDINTLDQALEMIVQAGELVNRDDQAKRLAALIRNNFDALSVAPFCPALSVAYFIWKDPYLVAGADTFINEMICRAGWKNAFSGRRYPAISAGDLRQANPQVILLSSEPYPFKQKHIDEFQKICPGSLIKVVDGEPFCWYGSRLQYTPDYFHLLNNEFSRLKTY